MHVSPFFRIIHLSIKRFFDTTTELIHKNILEFSSFKVITKLKRGVHPHSHVRTISLITPSHCAAEKEYASVAGTRDGPVSNMECAVSLTTTPQKLKKKKNYA